MSSSASGDKRPKKSAKKPEGKARRSRSPVLTDKEFIAAANRSGMNAQLMSDHMGNKVKGRWLKHLDDILDQTESSPLIWKYYEVSEGDLAQWETGIGLREAWFLRQIADSRADIADGAASKSPHSSSCNDPSLEPKGALRVQEFHIAHSMMKFLWFFKQEKTIAGATDKGDIAWRPLRRWRTRYPWFNALIADEMALAHGHVVRATFERAVHGTDKPLVYQGVVMTKIARNADGSIMSAPDGTPIEVPETVREYHDNLIPLALQVTADVADARSGPGAGGTTDLHFAAQAVQVEDVRDKVMQRLAGRLQTTTMKPEADKRGVK